MSDDETKSERRYQILEYTDDDAGNTNSLSSENLDEALDEVKSDALAEKTVEKVEEQKDTNRTKAYRIRGIDSAPEKCPCCGEDSYYSFHVMDANSKSKLSCRNSQCDYTYTSSHAIQELPRVEQTCHGYDCAGDLGLVSEKLYFCDGCGRHNGIASTTSEMLYSISICPICMTTSPHTIDFHHWDYEKNVGVYICRDCHNYIHDGKRARRQTQDSPDGESWKESAINNLVSLHEENNGRAKSWDAFFQRYNIPDQHSEYKHIRSLEL